MRGKNHVSFIFMLWIFISLTEAGILTNMTVTINETLADVYSVGPSVNKTEPSEMGTTATVDVHDSISATSIDCRLQPKNLTAMLQLKDILRDGLKMIRYNMKIDSIAENTSLIGDTSNLFRPFVWVKVNGRQGAGLLYLREQFDILSMFTLAIGVQEIDIELIDTPERCLGSLDSAVAEKLLRETVMNGLNINDTDVKELLTMNSKDQVCNMHIIGRGGYAEFRHYCCKKNLFGKIECQYLYESLWVNILLYSIYVLQILMLLFAPICIPKAYYTLKYYGAPYLHKLSDNVKINLNIMLTTKPESFSGIKSFKLSKFKRMTQFLSTIRQLKAEVPYQIQLEDIHLRAKKESLIAEHVIPVGLWSKLYETFVMCNLRKNDTFAHCCYSNTCFKSPCRAYVSWYKVLRCIMMFFSAFVFILPWILRVALYFFYEHDDMDLRRKAADDNNLNMRFPGSYTLYVTPFHISFIIVYVLLSVEYCVYGVLGEEVKKKFKYVLQACFRDMHNRNKGEVIGWAVRLALLPCTKFGFFGIFICLIAWVIGLPFMILFLAFYLLPTVNITLRLAAHFFVFLPSCGCRLPQCDLCFRRFDPEEIITSEKVERDERIMASRSGRCQQLFVIIFSTISLYSILFLLTELVTIVVEIMVYTLMGIILNASKTLAFVSLFFLLFVYGCECFGHVSKTFLAFNTALNKAILKLGKEKCEEVMYLPQTEQENNAFMLNAKNSSEIDKPFEIVDVAGRPRWRLSRMILFFSRYDVPQIPASLFFRACKMPFGFVPGTVLKNYVIAALEFSAILVFLMFVFLVVIAFGDTYQISTSNQLLATVIGGLLPKLLQKIFKSHNEPKIDDKSIQFKVFLHDLLENYTHDWPVFDFVPKQDSVPKQMESFGPQRKCSFSSTTFSNTSSSAYHSAGISSSNDNLKQNGKAIENQEIKMDSISNEKHETQSLSNVNTDADQETQMTNINETSNIEKPNSEQTVNETAESDSERSPLITDSKNACTLFIEAACVSPDKKPSTSKVFSFDLLIDASDKDCDLLQGVYRD